MAENVEKTSYGTFSTVSDLVICCARVKGKGTLNTSENTRLKRPGLQFRKSKLYKWGSDLTSRSENKFAHCRRVYTQPSPSMAGAVQGFRVSNLGSTLSSSWHPRILLPVLNGWRKRGYPDYRLACACRWFQMNTMRGRMTTTERNGYGPYRARNVIIKESRQE